MRKQLCMLWVIMMLLGLTACGNDNTAPSQTDSSTQQEENGSAMGLPLNPSAVQDKNDADTQPSQASETLTEDTGVRLFGEIKIVPESYNSSASGKVQ